MRRKGRTLLETVVSADASGAMEPCVFVKL